MNLLTARLRSLLPALLLLSLPACAEPDNATNADTSLYEGRVLEAGTQKPIPGAIVLGRWTEVRSAWVDTQDVCVHVETTTSDEDGRFRLPRYRGRNPTLFDSHKAGYEAYRFNTTEAYSRQESWLQRSTAGRGALIPACAQMTSCWMPAIRVPTTHGQPEIILKVFSFQLHQPEPTVLQLPIQLRCVQIVIPLLLH